MTDGVTRMAMTTVLVVGLGASIAGCTNEKALNFAQTSAPSQKVLLSAPGDSIAHQPSGTGHLTPFSAHLRQPSIGRATAALPKPMPKPIRKWRSSFEPSNGVRTTTFRSPGGSRTTIRTDAEGFVIDVIVDR